MKTGQFHNTIFYIIPHADDWQLFMNPQTYYDIISRQNRVIFIVTTAGDAGMGEQFYRAREEGMKASVFYCFKPGEKFEFFQGSKKFNDGMISYWSVNNVTSYFLRLPDGGVRGEGFKENNYKNLQRLEEGIIGSLISLDGNVSISSWSGFCALLEQIITGESKTGNESLKIKFLDPDAQKNPLDHADHQSTGRAILSLSNLPLNTKILFKGYGNSCAKSLTPEEIFWKAGIFAVYEKTVFDKTGYSTLAEDVTLYKKWILSQPEFYAVRERMESNVGM